MAVANMVGDNAQKINDIKKAVATVFMGRSEAIDLALICLLSDGHLLIEDVPGSGKTSLSAALARALGLEFNRVQCTNDLLPADITGLSVFDRQTGQFSIKEGPVFTQILLADELNRAPSKTQSALLQAMEEREVSIDTVTKPLPTPFLVIATQNPRENIGTFDLPESQLDRFSLSMSIGRPDTKTQQQILMQSSRKSEVVQAVVSSDIVSEMQQQVSTISIQEDVLSYLLRLSDDIEARCQITLSVRYRQQLLALARASAYLDGRDYVTPDDVKTLVPHSLHHRLGRGDKLARQQLLNEVLAQTQMP